MIGSLGSFSNPSASISDPQDLYIHGYVSSRIMRLAQDPAKPLKVCVSASKTDGLILALTPFSHSYNYRSAVIFGTAELVTDKEEKLWAMELVTEGVLTDRWVNARVPPDEGELQSTNLLRITIDSASAKIRTGEPHDSAKVCPISSSPAPISLLSSLFFLFPKSVDTIQYSPPSRGVFPI